jgi:hypothetical protein
MTLPFGIVNEKFVRSIGPDTALLNSAQTPSLEPEALEGFDHVALDAVPA